MKTCRKCGDFLTFRNMGRYKNECRQCYNLYMRQYRADNYQSVNERSKESMRTLRWLNGGERFDDMGSEIKVNTRSVNGRLILKIT